MYKGLKYNSNDVYSDRSHKLASIELSKHTMELMDKFYKVSDVRCKVSKL